MHKRVIAERKFQIDAAIVKVMKTQKSVTHQTLVKETISLVRFPLEASQINQRIDSLVGNNYMELAEEGADKFAPGTVYNYLA